MVLDFTTTAVAWFIGSTPPPPPPLIGELSVEGHAVGCFRPLLVYHDVKSRTRFFFVFFFLIVGVVLLYNIYVFSCVWVVDPCADLSSEQRRSND